MAADGAQGILLVTILGMPQKMAALPNHCQIAHPLPEHLGQHLEQAEGGRELCIRL